MERIVFQIVLVSSFSTTTHAKILSTPFEFLWGGTWLEEAICVVNSFSLVLLEARVTPAALNKACADQVVE